MSRCERWEESNGWKTNLKIIINYGSQHSASTQTWTIIYRRKIPRLFWKGVLLKTFWLLIIYGRRYNWWKIIFDDVTDFCPTEISNGKSRKVSGGGSLESQSSEFESCWLPMNWLLRESQRRQRQCREWIIHLLFCYQWNSDCSEATLDVDYTSWNHWLQSDTFRVFYSEVP